MPSHNCKKEGEVARIAESLKVAHHRIDDLEKQSDLLMELVATVRVIAEQMTSINEKVGSNTVWINENKEALKRYEGSAPFVSKKLTGGLLLLLS